MVGTRPAGNTLPTTPPLQNTGARPRLFEGLSASGLRAVRYAQEVRARNSQGPYQYILLSGYPGLRVVRDIFGPRGRRFSPGGGGGGRAGGSLF